MWKKLVLAQFIKLKSCCIHQVTEFLSLIFYEVRTFLIILLLFVRRGEGAPSAFNQFCNFSQLCQKTAVLKRWNLVLCSPPPVVSGVLFWPVRSPRYLWFSWQITGPSQPSMPFALTCLSTCSFAWSSDQTEVS